MQAWEYRDRRYRCDKSYGIDAAVEKRIAFFTFGVMKAPIGDAIVQGFADRLEGVYAAAEGSTGFFARSVRNYQTWEHSWGPVLAPRCTPQGVALSELAMTLSVWRDLESVAAFAYRGLHGEALSSRSDWFKRGPWPGHVAWWTRSIGPPGARRWCGWISCMSAARRLRRSPFAGHSVPAVLRCV